jgi:hypothetical protein
MYSSSTQQLSNPQQAGKQRLFLPGKEKAKKLEAIIFREKPAPSSPS